MNKQSLLVLLSNKDTKQLALVNTVKAVIEAGINYNVHTSSNDLVIVEVGILQDHSAPKYVVRFENEELTVIENEMTVQDTADNEVSVNEVITMLKSKDTKQLALVNTAIMMLEKGEQYTITITDNRVIILAINKLLHVIIESNEITVLENHDSISDWFNMPEEPSYSDKSKSYILDVIENLFKSSLNDLKQIVSILNIDVTQCYINLYNDEQLKMRLLWLIIPVVQSDIKNVYKLISFINKQDKV